MCVCYRVASVSLCVSVFVFGLACMCVCLCVLLIVIHVRQCASNIRRFYNLTECIAIRSLACLSE